MLLMNLYANAGPLSIDKTSSFFAATTHRSGLLGFVGHEHGISANEWTATVVQNPDAQSTSSVEIVVEAASLIVDTPESRKMAGLDAGGPSEEDRAKVKEKMLGPDVLDVAHYPQIRFKSSGVKSGSSGLVIEGDFSLHGKTQHISGIPIKVDQKKDGATHFAGGFKFHMSDYGITPPSGGGVVNVKDEMEIHFELTGRSSF